MSVEKIVEDAHIRILHGGVSLTMAEVRREYWIPRLRSLTKVRKACHDCKRPQVTAFNNLSPGELPEDRTVGSRSFEVLGVDHAGPIYYHTKKSRGSKVFLLIFLRNLTRAVHIQALQNQTTNEFIQALKLFIARRRRPCKIYSDNAQTFLSAAKWVIRIVKNEKVNDLVQQEISWQFNLSRAP